MASWIAGQESSPMKMSHSASNWSTQATICGWPTPEETGTLETTNSLTLARLIVTLDPHIGNSRLIIWPSMISQLFGSTFWERQVNKSLLISVILKGQPRLWQPCVTMENSLGPK